MQHSSSWKPNSSSDSEDTCLILRKPKIYHCVLESPLLIRIRCHTKPIHTLPSYFFRINFIITLPSTSRPSNKTLNSRTLKNRLILKVNFTWRNSTAEQFHLIWRRRVSRKLNVSGRTLYTLLHLLWELCANYVSTCTPLTPLTSTCPPSARSNKVRVSHYSHETNSNVKSITHLQSRNNSLNNAVFCSLTHLLW